MRKVAVLIFVVCFASMQAQTALLDSLTLDTTTAYTDLSKALKNPEKVVKLVLKRKKFKSFPEEIFQFTNLQYLDISKNAITTIPGKIGTLKNLQHFTISKTGLQYLPPQIGDLENLYYLNANQNEIYELPVEIGKLSKLKYLDLWDNNIDVFPEQIKNCKQLREVDLRNIMISDAKQKQIQSLLRHTKIHFSPYCNCQQ